MDFPSRSAERAPECWIFHASFLMASVHKWIPSIKRLHDSRAFFIYSFPPSLFIAVARLGGSLLSQMLSFVYAERNHWRDFPDFVNFQLSHLPFPTGETSSPLLSRKTRLRAALWITNCTFDPQFSSSMISTWTSFVLSKTSLSEKLNAFERAYLQEKWKTSRKVKRTLTYRHVS